jgi:2-oxoglutarate dehydrogenase E1 component
MAQTYIEDLFEQYQADPASVPAAWQHYFANGAALPVADKTPTAIPGGSESVGEAATAQNNVSRLIQGYRYHGHRHARVNPLAADPPVGDELSLAAFNLREEQLTDIFATAGILPDGHAPLRDIVAALQKTYCGSLSLQLGEVSSLEERRWLRERMEGVQGHPSFTKEQKHAIYKALMQANGFEKFLHNKFTGMKRFSIEGGDALIPMLQTMVDEAGAAGMTDIVFGMAHRGRLNVLVNIMGKPLEEIFAAFGETAKSNDPGSSGDVKYHQGRSYDVTAQDGHTLHMSLLNNPSHLEAVNPVVLGSARAKQIKQGEDGYKKVLPLLIHGDSAFAGQGVVPESLNLANLTGYTVGGTVHVIINNQVGFTANPEETFSGEYCTDIARMLQTPIFHVNGDDPEACVYAMQLALMYRNTFHKDVFIDLVCYRRHGHNEGDDPSFTQPVMYKAVKPHPVPPKVYEQHLLKENSLTQEEAAAYEKEYTHILQDAHEKAQQGLTLEADVFAAGSAWSGFKREGQEPETKASKQRIQQIATTLTIYPKGFSPNKKVHKITEQRADMLMGAASLNWGAAEVAAYGTLLAEGYHVRLSGQDIMRGTFSHRHIGLVDENNGARVYPIGNMGKEGAALEVHNSCLSELAVLGFEYGYSLAAPKTLTVWEAQFGDFSNGAQIIIDQFIASSEVKWQRMSGLTMLLPHGFEGQGPEHSSARLERYLQLCGNYNMNVATPTTPAQVFHLLRRQMLRNYRKPLIIISPKSLLRHPRAVSDVAELYTGAFQQVIDDDNIKAKEVKRIALCGGKIYYDLRAKQEETHRKDIALVRIEELHPLPVAPLQAVLENYKTDDILWVQEEPRNQGAWTFLQDNLWPKLAIAPRFIGRPVSASPAVGSTKRHMEEQERIVNEVFST